MECIFYLYGLSINALMYEYYVKPCVYITDIRSAVFCQAIFAVLVWTKSNIIHHPHSIEEIIQYVCINLFSLYVFL